MGESIDSIDTDAKLRSEYSNNKQKLDELYSLRKENEQLKEKIAELTRSNLKLQDAIVNDMKLISGNRITPLFKKKLFTESYIVYLYNIYYIYNKACSFEQIR